ncbi:hypothetical protein CC1G_15327 [Coprinopsis cinerea okayama7|uniref:HMG domain-containing protein n=1 Tax=Coprinopsis cinerea (strain Okayama-7 / 130 / ATCC MYA-4618 / FGSC 9003) TaxID=240176 RepID=D6RQ06_COPC7|nr:hypothetical protein CC1G_15327 [Coprinopsis cinerea okayama7\|eukprot:XP_002910420.1 hypothetical protein CC1G_15327 [Coprinopsis cinerea okayama7\
MSSRRRRRRILDDSDDESTANDYPVALLDAAREEDWDSPTKNRRTVTIKPKPRQDIGRRKKQRVEEEVVRGNRELSEIVDDPVSGNSEIEPAHSGSPDTQSEISEPDLDAFVDAINAHVAGFYHLERNLFVVQGWDIERKQTTDHWHHLEYETLDGEILVACTCPSGMEDACVHQAFFKHFEIESLMDMREERNTESPAVLFLQRSLPTEEVVSMFSVQSSSSSALRGRAIDHGQGGCVHVRRVQEMVGGLGDIVEGSGREGRSINEIARSLTELGTARSGTISYRRIHVPAWASLPNDPELYPRPLPFRSVPDGPLRLDMDGSCPCASGRTKFNPMGPIELRQCRIYTFSVALEHTLEVQRCPTCPPSRRRYIGPDLRDRGLFNYNNSILVSHELLDEYTSAYTLSETPFSAWVQHMARRYRNSGQTFMGEDLFRAIWFSYVSLQQYDDDMKCARCGDFPETVIWDGITLAFSRKHLRSTLKPPTTPSAESLVRERIRYQPHQHIIQNPKLRRTIRLVMDPPSLDSLSDWEEEELSMTTGSPTKANRLWEAKLIQDHLDRLDRVKEGLLEICPALSNLFDNVFRLTYAQRESPSSVCKNFFRQISAEESVLQLVNAPSMDAIRSFLQNPCSDRFSLLIPIPAVYQLFKAYEDTNALVPVLRWILERAEEVLNGLKVESPLPEGVVST